ncbi:MAG: phosphoglycerate kinase [Inquilinaceae bacterium]
MSAHASDFKTLDDIDVAGKTVLVRGDLNVPMKDGAVTDATRLERLAPTLIELADKGARVVVLSHFGRPKGTADPKYSLRSVVTALEKAVGGRSVAFAEDCVGARAEAAVAAAAGGDIVLLENLRFHPGEERNDSDFAAQLAALGDLYVNDAFSAAHRAHASTEAIARLLPAAAGRLMQAELQALGRALDRPQRPVVAIVGGAKISTKLTLLENMVRRVDVLVLGGGMANTFLHASGTDMGASLCEKDMADQARRIADTAKGAGCEIMLPTDGVVAREFAENAANEVVAVDAIPADAMMLDIGPGSVRRVVDKLSDCRTIVWNGPLGAFEIAPFDAGTNDVARHAATLTQSGRVLTVAGGGDTVAALARAGVLDKFSYVSTAGGAFLEWLEGKDLPGVAALKSV